MTLALTVCVTWLICVTWLMDLTHMRDMTLVLTFENFYLCVNLTNHFTHMSYVYESCHTHGSCPTCESYHTCHFWEFLPVREPEPTPLPALGTPAVCLWVWILGEEGRRGLVCVIHVCAFRVYPLACVCIFAHVHVHVWASSVRNTTVQHSGT